MTNQLTAIRTFAPAISFVLFVAYSIIVTTSGGELSGVASPMLVAAVAALVWHAQGEEQS